MLKSCCRVVEFISGKDALTAQATATAETPDPYVPGESPSSVLKVWRVHFLSCY